jgi:UDP-glucuronate decarboxylase
MQLIIKKEPYQLRFFMLFSCIIQSNKEMNLMAQSKRVVVTGGAGFLGSHLCIKLVNLGYHVIALDNLYTGRLINLAPIMHHNLFTFINHNIIEPIDIATDWIFNLACPASPPHYQKDPIFTTKTSVLGSLNMLELAKKQNARILQASTSEVYGDPTIHPQQEKYWGNVNPNGIRSCYDEGKRCAESIFFDYHRKFGTEIKVVRIFNTYGPHMDPDDGRVVSNFIIQALQNKPLTMYGDGTQTRSFCYVDDLIDGFIAMMHSPTNIIGPINLGNPNELCLLDLAKKIVQLTGSASTIMFEPLPQDDPCKRQPDIRLAQLLLEWTPKIGLHQGLIKTIEYFQMIHMKQNQSPNQTIF